MNTRRLIHSTLYCAALGLATGCGSSSGEAFNAGPSTAISVQAPQAASARLTGTVRDESGLPQSGVDVVLEERTTDLEVRTTSGSDGTFSFELPPGTYDAGLDMADPATATCYYGPVIVTADGRRDFTLKSAIGHRKTEVFGEILLQPGVPSAHQKLVLESDFGRGFVPAPVETTTGTDGGFVAQVEGQDLGMDIDVYQAGLGLEEHIDILKLDKPCYVQFSTDVTPVENRLGAGEADPPTPSALAGQPFKFPFQAVATGGFLPDGGVFDIGALLNGTLQRDGQIYTLESIISSGLNDLAAGPRYVISHEVTLNGQTSKPVIMSRKAPSSNITEITVLVNENSYFSFYDGNTEEHALNCVTKGWHKLTFDNDRPEIYRIDLATAYYP